jgi:hypothetical protein
MAASEVLSRSKVCEFRVEHVREQRGKELSFGSTEDEAPCSRTACKHLPPPRCGVALPEVIERGNGVGWCNGDPIGNRVSHGSIDDVDPDV